MTIKVTLLINGKPVPDEELKYHFDGEKFVIDEPKIPLMEGELPPKVEVKMGLVEPYTKEDKERWLRAVNQL